jgi:nucleoredoxin
MTNTLAGEAGPAWASELLGDTLVNAAGEEIQTSTLEGKKVALYFSASWCPPCRTFTPKLVDFYNKTAESHDDFEIVFISGDKNGKAMTKYLHKMPWLAMPFNREKGSGVFQKFGVRGIPSLIVLDEKGEVVDASARAAVTDAPDEAYDGWFASASED